MSIPIPQPPTLPFLGNAHQVDVTDALASLMKLGEKYGPLYKLNILGKTIFLVGSARLLEDLCDQKRFGKSITGPLLELRAIVSDALFTAHTAEPNWAIAHRILVPAFGAFGVQNMFDEMYDVASQMVVKWARQGDDNPIDVTNDFTCLTLDALALCAMDTRLNSFYRETKHEFLDAIDSVLLEAWKRTQRTRIESFFNRAPEEEFQKNASYMKDFARDVLKRRLENPTDKKDLLNAMIHGRDPKTGHGLDEERIVNNIITFLIAGHETTGSLLSFASYYLCKHPQVFQKARDEIGNVIGQGSITHKLIHKLPYLEAILRETLRLYAPAPGFRLKALPSDDPIIIGEGYLIPPGQDFLVMLPAVGRDKEAFGEDADDFRPERMYGENLAKIPKNAWKPFGNGYRGCIGRSFAWQESLLTLAMIIKNFDISCYDPEYTLEVKQTLTIKPKDFFMRATLRKDLDPISLQKSLYGGLEETKKTTASEIVKVESHATKKPMIVLVGSNSGTCDGLAQKLCLTASSHGYTATIHSLDSAVDNLESSHPTVIITSSYEGQPPDNAASFVGWLETAESTHFKDCNYAVFGCGHRDWEATFQRIPTRIFDTLKKHGATPIIGRGQCDVADGKVLDVFDEWQDTQLWPALCGSSTTQEMLFERPDMRLVSNPRIEYLGQVMLESVVVDNKVLTKPGDPEKCHTLFHLPSWNVYEPGDYLTVLPINSIHTVSRILTRFKISLDATITYKSSHATIPCNRELSIVVILCSYVELFTPATKKDISTLLTYTTEPLTISHLKSLIDTTTMTPSVFSILESHPSTTMPFEVFLTLLSPLKIRTYSISSSPLISPEMASITYSVPTSTSYPGVATSYLQTLKPGTAALISIKKSPEAFHLPSNINTPIIMICAGAGIAPFRGFIEHRAALLESGMVERKNLGRAYLFIGCRNRNSRVYVEELENWASMGVVEVYYAFSQEENNTDDTRGCKYVQDRVWKERDTVWRPVFDEDEGKVFVCGSEALSRGFNDLVVKIELEKAEKVGKALKSEDVLKWWRGLRGLRYAIEVFS